MLFVQKNKCWLSKKCVVTSGTSRIFVTGNTWISMKTHTKLCTIPCTLSHWYEKKTSVVLYYWLNKSSCIHVFSPSQHFGLVQTRGKLTSLLGTINPNLASKLWLWCATKKCLLEYTTLVSLAHGWLERTLSDAFLPNFIVHAKYRYNFTHPFSRASITQLILSLVFSSNLVICIMWWTVFPYLLAPNSEIHPNICLHCTLIELSWHVLKALWDA